MVSFLFSHKISTSVLPGGSSEKSCLLGVLTKFPFSSLIKGLAITLPTAYLPLSIFLAILQIVCYYSTMETMVTMALIKMNQNGDDRSDENISSD